MYYKSVNKKSNKDMFEFLVNHFQYFTLNSWNGLKSIANNVKIYNIKELDYDILEYLQLDNYYTINDAIELWEMEHNGYRVGFNGRSDGYLVLYNENDNKSVLDYFVDININSDYESFKQDIKESEYQTLKNYHYKLVKQVELVQDFDKLCDDLIQVCLNLKNNYEIAEEEQTITKKVTILREKEEANNL